MINEKDKMIIYNQLIKFTNMADFSEEKMMSKDKFLELPADKMVEYAFSYRDECADSYEKLSKENKKRDLYIELPDMDLSGINMKNFYLHDFMAGYAVERSDGKKVFITTRVNLKDTNCVVNMGSIRPIILSIDGKTIREITADITKCDFRGCKVFGKFQNSNAKLEYFNDNLPEDYMNRLKEFKVPDSVKLTTTDVYNAINDGKLVRGMNGLEKIKQMVDYDMTDINEKIWKYREIIRDYNIDISYTGVFIHRFGLDSVGKENYLINLEKQAKEAYMKGDMDYVEHVFKSLDKNTKKSLVGLALKDRQC